MTTLDGWIEDGLRHRGFRRCFSQFLHQLDVFEVVLVHATLGEWDSLTIPQSV